MSLQLQEDEVEAEVREWDGKKEEEASSDDEDEQPYLRWDRLKLQENESSGPLYVIDPI